jgi:hypothetical protein
MDVIELMRMEGFFGEDTWSPQIQVIVQNSYMIFHVVTLCHQIGTCLLKSVILRGDIDIRYNTELVYS